MGYLKKPTVTKVEWPFSLKADTFLKRHDFKDTEDANSPKLLKW